jgi:4-hydroxybenzoate polyprenyltransferase
MSWLSIIRPKNLIIIILLQWIVWNFIFLPVSTQAGIPLLLQSYFSWLIFITVIIASGGYMINDIFDIRSDRINHPQRLLAKEEINLQIFIAYYVILVIIGGVLAVSLALKVDRIELIWIYPLAVALLFWYSSKGKSIPWAGNIVVAILCAFAILIFAIGEWNTLLDVKIKDKTLWYRTIISVSYLAIFSFLMTWIREMVKDIQDYEGDLSENIQTVATVSGIKKAGKFVKILIACALLLLLFCLIIFYSWISMEAILYHCIFIGGLLVRSLVWLNKSSQNAEYSNLSNILKLIMVAGITGILLIV